MRDDVYLTKLTERGVTGFCRFPRTFQNTICAMAFTLEPAQEGYYTVASRYLCSFTTLCLRLVQICFIVIWGQSILIWGLD